MQGQTANCTLNVLKAHAAAVEEFRKIVPGGKISMNLNSDWAIPLHENDELDKARILCIECILWFSTSYLAYELPDCQIQASVQPQICFYKGLTWTTFFSGCCPTKTGFHSRAFC